MARIVAPLVIIVFGMLNFFMLWLGYHLDEVRERMMISLTTVTRERNPVAFYP